MKTMGKIPDSIFKDLSPKQRGNITKWSKNVFRGDYLIGRGLRDLEKVDIIIEIENLKKLNLDQDILLKLVNAKKLHHLAFFDSSIVTCGKITELVLKRIMEKEKIIFDNKSGLSKLFNTLKSRVTFQKHGDKILENIQEIIRIIRNTYAHDNPKIATKEESELV
ncbi:MAG: hypothetical protein HeimC3_17220 [Candidatus Heimdallarchaeota archaeon LC_3]|nr:MAG: hypothetical protein HeimC3_17220 [Candidatus Heimdallarchaeota archaeon LC_3]